MAQVYTVTDLGPLAPTGINTWGQVIGNYNGHAYIWTKTRGMHDLGILPGGTFSRAAAINDSGMVLGTADEPGILFDHDAHYAQGCWVLSVTSSRVRREPRQGCAVAGVRRSCVLEQVFRAAQV
jgi:hypothetical protein